VAEVSQLTVGYGLDAFLDAREYVYAFRALQSSCPL
jgi:hypothetical protein